MSGIVDRAHTHSSAFRQRARKHPTSIVVSICGVVPNPDGAGRIYKTFYRNDTVGSIKKSRPTAPQYFQKRTRILSNNHKQIGFAVLLAQGGMHGSRNAGKPV